GAGSRDYGPRGGCLRTALAAEGGTGPGGGDSDSLGARLRLHVRAAARDGHGVGEGTDLPVPRRAFCAAWTGWSVPGLSRSVRFAPRDTLERLSCAKAVKYSAAFLRSFRP